MRTLVRGLIRRTPWPMATYQAAIRRGDGGPVAWSCAHRHNLQEQALMCADGALNVWEAHHPPAPRITEAWERGGHPPDGLAEDDDT